jgi:branched-chain amino acid transport system permease protein
MVAGFILGLVEILSASYLGTSWRDFFTFAILISLLMFRPTGLFGTRVTRD